MTSPPGALSPFLAVLDLDGPDSESVYFPAGPTAPRHLSVTRRHPEVRKLLDEARSRAVRELSRASELLNSLPGTLYASD